MLVTTKYFHITNTKIGSRNCESHWS